MKRVPLIITLILFFKSNFAQVNLQTGGAEQSFPLINYTDGKAGLSLGVGLAYSSGNGLLVNDLASNVGTGWNLDAGGMVTRIQQGEPDDQPESNGPPAALLSDGTAAVNSVLKRYPNGYMYNPHVGKGCNVGLNYTPLFNKQNAVYKELNITASDVEQDKFMFRANGRTGIFIIPHNWSATRQCKVMGDAKIKITFTVADMRSQGIRTTIDKFIITTEDGIKYTFKDKALTWICRYKDSYRDGAGNWVPYQGAHNNDNAYAVNFYKGYLLETAEKPFVVNSWYLSEVENPNTGQKVTYSYDNVLTDVISSKYINHQRKLNESNGWWCSCEDAEQGLAWFRYLYSDAAGTNANSYSWDLNKLNRLKPGATTVFFNRSVGYSKRLTSIDLANGGKITFNYAAKPRLDLKGDNALEEITYLLNGNTIRQYRFTYGYFFNNVILDYNTYSPISEASKPLLRLCLLSVQKIGNGEDNASEPPYKFTYYMGSNKSSDDIVPGRNFLNQDHWGYYNGDNSITSVYEDHDNLSSPRGYTFATFPWLKNPKDGYAKNGLLKEIIYPTGGKLLYTYGQIIPASSVLPPQYASAISAGGVSVTSTTLTDPEFPTKNIKKNYRYVKPGTNISSYWGVEAPSYFGVSTFENNLRCGYGFRRGGLNKFKHTGLLYPEMATTVEANKNLGALLVSAAISVAVGIIIQNVFNGTIVIPILNIIQAVVIVYNFINIIIACGKTRHYFYYSLSNINSKLSNPLPSYFSSVEVKTNSPGGGYDGRTVYEFTSPADYPLLVPQLKWPYIQNQRLAIWAYGNPKKITVYDKNDQLVNQTQNSYKNVLSIIPSEITNNTTRTLLNYNCKCATINKEVIRSDDWANLHATWFSRNQARWMVPIEYNYFTGRTDLTTTVQKQYTNGQLYTAEGTQYISDPATLLQKGKITYSDLTSLVIDINYYPTDYNLPGSAIQKLVDNNAIHVPVSTEKWLLKRNVSGNGSLSTSYFLIGSNVTEFNKYTVSGRTEVKPYRTYALKTDRPIPYSLIGAFNPSQLLRQPQYYKLQSEMIYDNGGNLVETRQDGNITSFVNDYLYRYVTASTVNASYTDIAFSSFETEGKGNWEFDITSINKSAGLTGTQSYIVNAANHVFKSGLSTSKNYYVTYWLKDGLGSSISVNGQAGTLLYSVKGWKLYKHVISGTSAVTVTGNGTIDEIRLYPENALMSTVIYKEGVGKVADCDANNRILYYEYDALGRLKLIRDQEKNVIKTYEYNYKK